MQKLTIYLSLWLFICIGTAKSQNLCLDFDGNNDYLTTYLPVGNSSFTHEMWFLSAENSSNQDCQQNFRALFALAGGQSTQFEIGLCGGVLNIRWNSPLGLLQEAIPTINFNTQNWHHLALVKNNQNLILYIDCNEVWSIEVSLLFQVYALRVGSQFNDNNNDLDWKGRMDEIRFWSVPKTQEEIIKSKNCTLVGSEERLILYWNFDEGIENGDNTNIAFIPDQSNFESKGIINTSNGGFELLPSSNPQVGNMSNYASSQAGLGIDLGNLDLVIRDYPYQNNALTSIISGEPAHFSLLQNGTDITTSLPDVEIEWYYIDEGSSAQVALPPVPFSGFNFTVPSEVLTHLCGLGSRGFVNRTFYAVASIIDENDNTLCSYQSESYTLRICCPLEYLEIKVEASDDICEGNDSTLFVRYEAGGSFLDSPGQETTIQWFLNNELMDVNQKYFEYDPSPFINGALDEACFRVEIDHPCGSIASPELCLTEHEKPNCGQIIVDSTENLITLLQSNDTLSLYEVCLNSAFTMRAAPIDSFKNCALTWEYSFDTQNWTYLARTNSIQNTNILPNEDFPDEANRIYYRVRCSPTGSGSPCEDCSSNWIAFELKEPTSNNSIEADNMFCDETFAELEVANPDADHSYEWFCNGAPVGEGASYSTFLNETKLFWFETTDECSTYESDRMFMLDCQPLALIRCPLEPNRCACLGEEITLEGRVFTDCQQNDFSLKWYVDGVLYAEDVAFITHTPPPTGSNYVFEVVDLTAGCEYTTFRTVIPCDKKF